VILAHDLGTKTGRPIGVHGRLVLSGIQDFKPRRFDGGGMRYLRFRWWLKEMAKNQVYERVVFEEVRRHLGVDAAHAYGGFLATLTGWCEEENIPYEGMTVQAIKTHATGNAGASKDDMKVAAYEWTGAVIPDDNQVDAIALLSLAAGEPPWPPQPKPPKKAKKAKA
jgi:hypothetical protein